MSYVLGVNAGTGTWHDASACLIDADGTVLALVEEERLSRVRHAPKQHVPTRAVQRCLELGGVTAEQLEAIAVGWDEPRMALRSGQGWEFDSPEAFLAALGLGSSGAEVVFVPHHRAHAASAFHASGRASAAVLVVDGNGEDESTSIFHARRGHGMRRVERWPQVHSLGHVYEAASVWLGLGKRGEGKTMGLAAHLSGSLDDPGWLHVRDGALASALGADPRAGYEETKHAWRALVARYAGQPAPDCSADRLDTDPVAVRVAAAAQHTVDTVLTWWAQRARERTGEHTLCLAGGVALNCAANGRLPGDIYVPPVPHDAGVALGAAWEVRPPGQLGVLSPYLGSLPGPVPDGDDLVVGEVDVDRLGELLAEGDVIGVCRGRAEAGPRALCHRSLLASPTTAGMRTDLNALKGREPWRPFGPVAAGGEHELWSSVGDLERYMLGAAPLTAYGRRTVPAARHADGTTRPQRLQPGDDALIHDLLRHLAASGHPPALLNTSFNGPGEPLVDSAADALDCARRLGLRHLVLEDHLVTLQGGR
ncbi:carbamoyltransferase C-terminal domain-containing protein [Saccharopolyspora griseoalba]|uniref:Carbamoyltransferase C-terminal domain-containing protein n=1 Tax=Saccharopolyspora griseoalba TaxID=1431848 RepID=A0ABW2LS98_9PSEU